MLQISQSMKFCMNFSVVHTAISKKLNSQLSIHGISFSEFMILYYLDHSPQKMLRRIDLADQVGLSASGITRLIAPMEKIGLVHKEANKRDARVSLVKISRAGERILEESGKSLEMVTEKLLSNLRKKNLEELLGTLKLLGGNIE